MTKRPAVSKATDNLKKPTDQDLALQDVDVSYRPVPHAESEQLAAWRLRFDVLSPDSVARFGLDVNGDAILGRGREVPTLVDLTPYDADELGVSRHHLMLRPKGSKLYIVDLGSTNGTRLNGRPIGINTPYGLSDGDVLTLGRLQMAVSIIKRPKGQVADAHEKADLADALALLAKTITSQLKLDEVLDQALEMAMSLTLAGETAIWLVDERTGELFLEAEHGIKDEHIKHMRLPVSEDNLAGRVIKTGEPLRTSREIEGKRVKIKTGYMVEAVLYVPLTLGGVTFGVLAAVHREPGSEFGEKDEQLLAAIGDFAAVAVQNSRLYEATDKALANRLAELTALNELSRAVTSSLDLATVHEALVEQLHRRWEVEDTGLWLVNQATKVAFPFSAAEDESDDIIHKTFKPGEGAVGKVVQTGEPLLAEDVRMASHVGSQEDLKTTTRLVARSMACVPLLIEGNVIGVLALFSKREDKLTDEDLERLEAFANPMATAIQNARLFAQSERERATVRATAGMFSQPLMIVNEQGELVLSNEAADSLWETVRRRSEEDEPAAGAAASSSLSHLLESLSHNVGRPTEMTIGDQTYVATVEHMPRVGTIIVMQDVTDVKKLERLRTDFAQAIAHDIRGPLGSIMGYARMLKELDLSREESVSFIDEILGAYDRMVDMTNELLDFALLSEAPVAHHSPFDLNMVATDTVRDLRGAALVKGIDLDFEVTGTPYRIRGDTKRLYRSMLNLIENAIKYSPESEAVRVRLAFEETGITIKVRDSGPGIPESELPHIFEKYYRAKNTSDRLPGVGLGLAMVRSTVEAHGGKVTARNVKGHGMQFTITLPAELRVA